MASHKKYDTLPLLGEYGKSNFFLTMTVNPNWSELAALSQLRHFNEHERHTRFDFITRVFHAKLKIFKEQVLEKQILDKVIGHD